MALPPQLSAQIRKAERERFGTLDLREKPKRFDADRPHRYAVARIDNAGQVPRERMTSVLKRLEFAGFRMMSDIEEIVDDPYAPLVLSTMPSVGSPKASTMFELLPLGFRPAPSCRLWLEATGQREVAAERKPVRLSAALGVDAGVARGGKRVPGAADKADDGAGDRAGAAPLKILFDGRLWVANAGRKDKQRAEIFRSAGWLPYRMISARHADGKVVARVGHGAWATRDPFLAHPFRLFMTDNARLAHDREIAVARRRIAMSNAADAPEGVEIPAPEGLQYLPYQKAGIHMSVENPEGAFIADDMGLGKTIQAAGIMNVEMTGRRNKAGQASRTSNKGSAATGSERKPEAKLSVVVFCQANMKIGWQRELEKWLVRDDHTIGIAEGDKWPDSDIVIINYDIASRHSGRLREKPWNIVIGDEAQLLGNDDTQRSVAILGDDGKTAEMIPLAPGGLFIPMSGTPIPSRTIQIYPLLSAMDPERWGKGSLGREIFCERYCAPRILKMPAQPRRGVPRGAEAREAFRPVLREDGAARLKELQVRMRAAGMVRRMKSDPRIMAALPPKFRRVVELPIELSAETRRMLVSAEADFAALGRAIADAPVPGDEEGFRISLSEEGFAAFRDMARLPDGGRADFQLMSRIRANLARLKAPMIGNYLIDALEASADAERPQKIVCFAHHRDVIQGIRDRVEQVYPGSVVTFIGGETKRRRQEAVDRLQEDERVRLFLGSIGAASTGLTLTRADRVIFAELDWVPVQLLQAEDRVWRIGQTENVLSEFLVIARSLEMQLARRIVDKLDLIAQAVGGNPRLSKGMEAIYAAAMEARQADFAPEEAEETDPGAQMRLFV